MFFVRRRNAKALDQMLTKHYAQVVFNYSLDDRSQVTYSGDKRVLQAELAPYASLDIDDPRYTVLLEILITDTSAVNYVSFFDPQHMPDMVGTAGAVAKLSPKLGDTLYLFVDKDFLQWFKDVCDFDQLLIDTLAEATANGPKAIATTVVGSCDMDNPCVFEHDGERMPGFIIGGGEDYSTVDIACAEVFGNDEPVCVNLSWFTPDSFVDAHGMVVECRDELQTRASLPVDCLQLAV